MKKCTCKCTHCIAMGNVPKKYLKGNKNGA